MYRAYKKRLEEERDLKQKENEKSTHQQPPNVPLVSTSTSSTPSQTANPPQTNAKPKLATKEEQMAMLEELKRKCDETKQMLLEAMAKQAQKSQKQSANLSIILGNLSMECPTTAKLVRIFTSSTFTDTEQERNAWMVKAYPRIKAFCQSKGYEFQVVDMRWGVRDEAMDDHMTTELCLQELKQCQKLSTGPNFISLLSHKYGYRSLPRQIEDKEFEDIYNVIESTEEKDLLRKWYVKDLNAVPAMYVLSPISTHLPDFVSADQDKKQTAKSIWWEQSEKMRKSLESSSKVALDGPKAKKYSSSVTEKEIEQGMLKTDKPDEHCLWFNRVIDDIEAQEHTKKLSRYIECAGDQDKVRISRHMLAELHREMRKVLGEKKIHTYSVHWSNDGIDPNLPDHKNYIEKMTQDFEKELCEGIDAAIQEKERNQVQDPVYIECMQHMVFCQEKCEQFQGRKEVLQTIKEYVIGDTCSNAPLVLHGPSGSGKTSIMAMAAKSAWSWMDGKGLIVMRFLGTSPESSNVDSLLRSILQLIFKINRMQQNSNWSFKVLTIMFYRIIESAAKKRKIVIFLDSLDQLDTANDARKVEWIRAMIPPNVKLIVSTLEEEKYVIFPNLKKKMAESCFVQVPEMTSDNASQILDCWLEGADRRLNDDQRNIVMAAFRECPLPLFLKLSFDEACKWTSYHKLEDTVLQRTVRESIITLFSRLERKHGLKLVCSALGFLTTARTGLSESELEDILSCDDDVLDDVYQYWTPPIRRLPPLLLVRLKTDLQHYLVNRGSEGIRVIYWYHRQFIQAAKSRYLSDEETCKKLHHGLAEYFSGTWADKPKPYINKDGKVIEEKRYVAQQPMKFGDKINNRKLNHLAYHWMNCQEVEQLKTDCLLNIDFLLNKILSYSNGGLMGDFRMARKMFPNDQQVAIVGDALNLSVDGLIFDPKHIISQLLDRLSGNKVVKDFLKQCENSPYPYILPEPTVLDKPGGPLVNTFAGHVGDITYVDVFKYPDGKIIAATCSTEDSVVKFWDVSEEILTKTYKNLDYRNPERITFAANGEVILCNYDKMIVAFDKCGAFKYVVADKKIGFFEVCRKENSTLLIFRDKHAGVYDALTGEEVDSIPYPEGVKIDIPNASYGSENYVVVTAEIQEKIGVLDLNTKQFSNFIKTRGETERVLITADETKIIRGTYDGDIVTYDLQTLKKIQSIEAKDNISSPMRLSPDGNSMYYGTIENVCVWNLQDMTKYTILPYHTSFDGVVTVDMKIFITISTDNVVRVWDSSKAQTEGEQSEPNMKMRDIYPMFNTRYIIKRWTGQKDETLLQVYDLWKRKVVRSCNYKANLNDYALVSNELMAVLTKSKKIKLLRLHDMTISMVFQGFCSNYPHVLKLCKNGKGLLTYSRGRMNMKIYSVETGKTMAILKQPPELKKRIDEVATNNTGNIAVCLTYEGPLLVFDVNQECLLSVIHGKADLKAEISVTNYVSPSGKFLAINVDRLIGRDSVSFFIIWDVYNKKVTHELVDLEDFETYQKFPSQDRPSVDSMEGVFIDDGYFAMCSDDGTTRVWDLGTGKVHRRLKGFKDSPEPYYTEGGQYLVLQSLMSEGFRYWDTQSWEPVASFKTDKMLFRTTMLRNGKTILSSVSLSSDVNIWNVCNHGDPVDFSREPELFDDSDINPTLNFYDDRDKDIDTDDPDSDPEEVDEDDDDDDDDDDNDEESEESVYDDDDDNGGGD